MLRLQLLQLLQSDPKARGMENHPAWRWKMRMLLLLLLLTLLLMSMTVLLLLMVLLNHDQQYASWIL